MALWPRHDPCAGAPQETAGSNSGSHADQPDEIADQGDGNHVARFPPAAEVVLALAAGVTRGARRRRVVGPKDDAEPKERPDGCDCHRAPLAASEGCAEEG